MPPPAVTSGARRAQAGLADVDLLQGEATSVTSKANIADLPSRDAIPELLAELAGLRVAHAESHELVVPGLAEWNADLALWATRSRRAASGREWPRVAIVSCPVTSVRSCTSLHGFLLIFTNLTRGSQLAPSSTGDDLGRLPSARKSRSRSESG